jgi:hypothetical protein
VDPQTRVGSIGGGALFVMIGVGTPLLGWPIGGAIMLLCAGVAAWGFWPLFGSFSLGHMLLWRVPLSTAAQICYEKAEDTPIGRFVEAEFTTEHDRLSYYVSSFSAYNVTMFGRQPPSRNARRIVEPAARNLAMAEGTNDLMRIAGNGVREFRDVYLLRTDLWKHLQRLKRTRRPQDF